MTFYKAFPVAPGINFCSCLSDTLKASPTEKEKQALFPSPSKESKTHSLQCLQQTTPPKSVTFSLADHIRKNVKHFTGLLTSNSTLD